MEVAAIITTTTTTANFLLQTPDTEELTFFIIRLLRYIVTTPLPQVRKQNRTLHPLKATFVLHGLYRLTILIQTLSEGGGPITNITLIGAK